MPKHPAPSASNASWNPPETAPSGTLILGDFGYPWPQPAIFDPYDDQWLVVHVQAQLMENAAYNYWLETETESPPQLKRWQPMPTLPKTSIKTPKPPKQTP
jgi:hypothetical protein